MKTIERQTMYQSPPEIVFHCLDSLGVAGMHMTQSSFMMMGSKLHLHFQTKHQTGLGTTYRWTGKMMGMRMDFTVQVTKWIEGKEKIWETVGKPQLLIYSWYRMHLQVNETSGGSHAKLSITYERPHRLFYKVLSFLFADWYCRWCLRHMLEDCNRTLSNDNSRHDAPSFK